MVKCKLTLLQSMHGIMILNPSYLGDPGCGNGLTRNFIPQFTCDLNTTLNVGYVYEPGFAGCDYYLPIQTRYACPGYTTTTTTSQPDGSCRWTIGNNTLDLNSVDSLVLNYVDPGSNNLHSLRLG